MGRDEPSTPECGPLPPDSDGLFFVFFAFRTRVHIFSLWVLGSPLHETWAPGPGLSLAPEKASLAHPPPAIDARRSRPEGWGGPGCLGSEPPTGSPQGSSRTPSWVPGVPPAAGTSGNCLVLTAQPCSRPKGGDWEGHWGEQGCRGHEGQSVYPEHEWSCGVSGTKGQVCGQTMPENPPFRVGGWLPLGPDASGPAAALLSITAPFPSSHLLFTCLAQSISALPPSAVPHQAAPAQLAAAGRSSKSPPLVLDPSRSLTEGKSPSDGPLLPSPRRPGLPTAQPLAVLGDGSRRLPCP